MQYQDVLMISCKDKTSTWFKASECKHELFRSISYVITGTEEQHLNIRRAITQQMMMMNTTTVFPLNLSYIRSMERRNVWATEIEIFFAGSFLDHKLLQGIRKDNNFMRGCIFDTLKRANQRGHSSFSHQKAKISLKFKIS